MAENSTHTIYSFEDIQRYLQGNMTATEMHAMEKAALQDPFLADAIEGYSEIPSSVAAQHLNAINASISAEHEKPRVVSFSRKLQWMRIAALLIILTGVGIIGSYIFVRSNKAQNVAQEMNKKKTDNALPLTKDSQELKAATPSLPENENANAGQEKNNSPEVQKKAEKNETSSGPKKITNEVATANKDESASQQSDVAVLMVAPSSITQVDSEKHKMDADLSFNLTNDKNTSDPQKLDGFTAGLQVNAVGISGKVVDENNQPVPAAVVQSADKKAITVSDANGNFSLQKQDSSVTVSASAVGYDTKTVELKAGSANVILLPENRTALNEVVVTGYGVKRNNYKQRTNSDASPVGGWENFNRYIRQQLNKDTTSGDDYQSNALVELEFSIDKEGNPINIKFLQSLDAARNAKALDIINHGPKWTAAKNKKVRIRIPF